MRIDTMEDLLIDHLRELHSAEKQIIAGMPDVISQITSPSLRVSLSDHLEEGAGQVARLGRIFELLGATSYGAWSRALEAMIADVSDLPRRSLRGPILDAAIVASIRRISRHQVAVYASAIALARHLGHGPVAEFLGQSLQEEENADESLSAIAQDDLYELAAHAAPVRSE
jgi:ferritin-like metal-binding protein YciE